jgi:signal peptidase I
MKASQPAQTKHTTWEGDSEPPLRLSGGSASVPPPTFAAQTAQRPAMAPRAEEPRQLFERSWFVRHLIVLACVAAFSLPAYFLASRFVVTAVVVQGRSMTPTLNDGERYFLNRWRYLFVAPDRGDMVVIKDPGHADFAVKRIVGKPKDWINIRDGKIFLNGKRLDEPYLPSGTRTDAPDMKEKWIQLGKGQYYVLGDNRKASEDSRYYGVIDRKHILGILVK